MDASFGFDDEADFTALMENISESQQPADKKRFSLKRKAISNNSKESMEAPKKAPLTRVKSNQKSGWITSAFDQHIDPKPSVKCKDGLPREEASLIKEAPLLNKSGEATYEEDWVTKYSPKSREELSVHIKKVDEVSHWLNSHLTGGLLLLTGPSGAGKTATIQTLCAIGYRNQPIVLREWNNETINRSSKYGDNMADEVEMLEEFMFRADRYCLSDDNLSTVYKALLIEEFPLQFSQDPQPLHSFLYRHSRQGQCPVILILSDTPSYEFSERFLFPKDVQQKLGIDCIHFNPVSNTLLTKTLNRIAKIESRKSRMRMPHKSVLDDLATQCQGDVRSIINQLQFLMARGKSNDKSDSKSKSARDSTMILFHALGKILYSKRLAEDSPEYATHKSTLPSLPHKLQHIHRPPTNFIPEEVIEQSRLPPPIFTEFLHENAPDFLGSINQLSVFEDYLSFNDAYCSRWFVENDLSRIYSGSLGARGFMWATVSQDNSSVTRRWRPLKRPQIGTVRRSQQNNFCHLRDLMESHCDQISSITPGAAISDYLPLLIKMQSHTITWNKRDKDHLFSLCSFKRTHPKHANLLNDGEWGFCENSATGDEKFNNVNPFSLTGLDTDQMWQYCNEEESEDISRHVTIDDDSD